MSENDLLEEEDIWEYRSIRKPKSQSQDDAGGCTQTTIKIDDGESNSKRIRRKKTESASKKAEMANERMLGKRLPSSPASTHEKDTKKPKGGPAVNSQSCKRSPSKPNAKKQSPRITRPIYDGHCPNCQMPFSALLGQTPRWHVDECLDAPGRADKECPEGLLCTSTIPSHYKRFTHLQLSKNRAGDGPATDDKRSLDENYGSAVATSESPEGGTGAKSTGNTQHHLPVDNSSNISYSPLCSDEEEASEENINNLRKRLFYSRPSEDERSEMEEGDLGAARGALNRPTGPHSTARGRALNQGREQHVEPNTIYSQAPGFESEHTCAPQPYSDSGKIKEEPDWSCFTSPASNEEACARKGLDLMGWYSTDLLSSALLLSPKVKKEEEMPVLTRSSAFQECNYKEEACSNSPSGPSCFSEFAVSQPMAVKFESLPSPQGAPARVLSVQVKKVRSVCMSSPDFNARAGPPKALKQTDIGVFFGLKPKAKEVPVPERGLSPKALSTHSGGTPNGNRPGQRKRKAGGSVADADTAPGTPQGTGISPKPAGNGQQGWPKRFRGSETPEGERGKKQCPFYKKIPGTGFTVDAFQFGKIEGCTAYFLTHFHSDHYGGLTKKFQFPIYCSKITGNLVRSKLRVQERFLHILPMDTECVVDGIKVVLLEANHCPGAVLLLFCLPNGTSVLHTGDFRADPSMEQYPALVGCKIHTLYLDTTYCSPEYTFPPQQEAIQFAVSTAFELVTLNPRTLVVCGTYSVGKEKVFLAIADVLGCKVSMSQDQYKTLQCLESQVISSMITTDWNSTSLHVLPMMQVNCKGLLSHLNKFSGRYDRVLAFKPTGWTYSDGCATVADVKPTIRGKITMYGIPYSEHSSYLEMKRFVQWLRPQKIIPTVNMGNWKSRTIMEKYFSQWMTEPTTRRAVHS